jgi:hypothetical protein
VPAKRFFNAGLAQSEEENVVRGLPHALCLGGIGLAVTRFQQRLHARIISGGRSQKSVAGVSNDA